MRKFWCWLTMAVLAHQAWALDPSPGNEILAAYAKMQYDQALKLAAKHPELSEARLVKALCAVFDRRKQNLSYGLPALKKIFEDDSIRPAMRAEAGLAYARAAQTLQKRAGIYPAAEGIDFNKIYDKIIADHPNSTTAIFAAVYQTQDWFNSANEKDVEKGFARLQNILEKFKGPKAFLGPIHYMLADQYIIHGRRYAEAVKQLEMALALGIANPRNREQVTYRIARINDVNMNNKTSAAEWYRRFIKEFPNSSSAPLAKRYLKGIDSGKKESGNG